jgi:hypothetical protein
LVDLNGDGHVDLISGSWPGEIFLFPGRPDRSFGPPETIKDKQREEINVSGGIQKEPGGGLLITGNAKWEETTGGWFVMYKGKRYKSTAKEPVSSTGCASVVHAADWDGDGDFDLIVGDIQGQVWLIPNDGTPTRYVFGKPELLHTESGQLRVEGDAGPFTADWDGDGDLDLLVGSGNGSVALFRNIGSRTAPRLASAHVLVRPGEMGFGDQATKLVRRGMRSKVCAADWNGDGRLDLLLGDFASLKPDLPSPIAEEKAKQDALRSQLAEVRRRYSEQVQKLYGPNRVKNDEELKKADTELKKVRAVLEELQAKLPPELEYHGWVWLFLRQPLASPANAR